MQAGEGADVDRWAEGSADGGSVDEPGGLGDDDVPYLPFAYPDLWVRWISLDFIDARRTRCRYRRVSGSRQGKGP